jgi:hypothetical protein
MHPAVQRLFERANIQQHTEEWYNQRGKMLTASDVACTVNMNPYKSRTRLLLQKLVQYPPSFAKVDERVRAAIAGDGNNSMTAWGNEMEDVAARRYEEITKKKCLAFGLFTHPEHEWLGASPDRITHDGVLVEIKCPVVRAITDEVPAIYFPQVQILMEVLDLEACDFVQFRPEGTWQPEELVVTRVDRDREWFHSALPKMQAFYDDWMAIRSNPDDYEAYVRDHQPKPRRRRRSQSSSSEEDISVVRQKPYPFLTPPLDETLFLSQ